MSSLRLNRARQGDDGQVLIALLGIMAMTTVVLVGLAAILIGQRSSRHDTRFDHALAAAETGLDQMVTQVRATPYAAGFTPMTGSAPQATWSVSATGGAGHWVLTASGTASDYKESVTRTLTERVDVADLLGNPLFADTSLTLAGAASKSGVDRYSSAVSSSVCGGDGLLGTSLLASGTHMCNPASPALGSVGTNGALTMKGASLLNMSGVDLYDTGVPGFPSVDDAGTCVGDSAACAAVGTTITPHEQELDFPLSSACQNGIGAGAGVYDGSLALAANAVYSFTDVTLNATAIANLSNLSGSTIVICFSGTLLIPPAVPLNTVVETVLPLKLAPRPPATLLLISTQAPSGAKPKVELGLPNGLNLGLPVSMSGVIYAPNADCTAHGHVDLYGAVVCGTMNAKDGINVHYDTQLGNLPFDQPIRVSSWTEVKP